MIADDIRLGQKPEPSIAEQYHFLMTTCRGKVWYERGIGEVEMRKAIGNFVAGMACAEGGFSNSDNLKARTAAAQKTFLSWVEQHKDK